MTRMLSVAKMLVFASVAFFLIALGIGALHIEALLPKLATTLDNGNALTASLNESAVNLNATLIAINRGCGDGHPCGTLADVAKTLGTIRGTAAQIEIAAHHEDKRIGVLDAQEATIYADMHRSLLTFNADLKSANATIAGVQPVEARLADAIVQMQTATASLNALLSNGDIPAIMNNANASTEHLDDLIGNADATVADVRQAVHKALHPTWPHKVLEGVEAAGHFVFAIVF